MPFIIQLELSKASRKVPIACGKTPLNNQNRRKYPKTRKSIAYGTPYHVESKDTRKHPIFRVDLMKILVFGSYFAKMDTAWRLDNPVI